MQSWQLRGNYVDVVPVGIQTVAQTEDEGVLYRSAKEMQSHGVTGSQERRWRSFLRLTVKPERIAGIMMQSRPNPNGAH